MNFKITLFVLGLCFLFPVDSFSKDVFSFDGRVDLEKEQIELKLDFLDRGMLFVKSARQEDSNLSVLLDIEHFKAFKFDISSEIKGLIEYSGKEKDTPDALLGRFWSDYTLLNYQPIRELTGHFEVKDQKLYLRSFSVGNVSFNGAVALVSPYNVDLAFNLSMIEMNDFIDFWMTDRPYDSGGLVSGTIGVAGNLNKIYLKGRLESHEGFIKKIRFNSLYLNVNGFYPNLEVFDSSIAEKEGLSFKFSGPIDLSDKENFKKQIKELTFMLDVKGSDSNAEWTIKKYNNEKGGSDTTELKYFLQNNPISGLLSNEGSGVLGVERRISF
ncbi:MAG: hypothetical protein A2Y03_01170 [Omnitrophica WOR_2 bacterium GWF2_38_59]|nr:MAG: hypothetical protein A2Y03_01170 [Omnitrophica WOR_2 bacterium GWF2_38_59]OGX49769.1 MAG: hypothetical protein A2243_11085 [Omnitrophica WOR_2 bacterium RIFOXYA2_FULL_38_17]OGX54107.1 MAG: hypothetical protein A2267_07850 [Omnitrophica WOR_2 bacterium RIFOXYA12_FULL_38_10]OGX55643.1 MAG: hypothetical protein A2447_11195 [Omnitrophica WOR_2 bacterium RIFOXYC2_FULL_38_12]OGX60087.1 MAG: hypothetical protein A2306_08660 [Omnitrophica WOR_2 bacterium RIFOXYB2_FULL_38_16]HBG61403.1 hypothet